MMTDDQSVFGQTCQRFRHVVVAVSVATRVPAITTTAAVVAVGVGQVQEQPQTQERASTTAGQRRRPAVRQLRGVRIRPRVRVRGL